MSGYLVYTAQYCEGDYILLEVDEVDEFYDVQFDEVKGKSRVYLTGNVKYAIPFDEKRKNISSKVFNGELHLLSVKKVYPFSDLCV